MPSFDSDRFREVQHNSSGHELTAGILGGQTSQWIPPDADASVGELLVDMRRFLRT